MVTTMQHEAERRDIPLILLRLMADSESLSRAYDLQSGHDYMDRGPLRPLTGKQYASVPEGLLAAFQLAELLCERGFTRCPTVEEFVALIECIQGEWGGGSIGSG